jgi:hypothetical protein
VDPCHHGMTSASSTCKWRNGLHVVRVTANILNKKSRTADKKWFSSFVFASGSNSIRTRNQSRKPRNQPDSSVQSKLWKRNM